MNEYKTLDRKSPEFESYLLGTFSNKYRAIPLKSLNVNTDSETVTFRIVKCSEVRRPRFFIYLLKLFKINKLIYVIFPMFVLLVKNIQNNPRFDSTSAVLSTIGVIFAFIASSLRSDYLDHVVGIDRIQTNQATKPIQRGWITAKKVNNISILFFIIAVFSATPVMLAYPELLFVVLLAFGVNFYSLYVKQNNYKYQLGGEIALFFIFGPLFSIGYQMSLGSPIDKECIIIGLLWGWQIFYMHNLGMLSDIMAYSQNGFRNIVTWLGFDRSRRFLAFSWAVYIVGYFFYNTLFAGRFWGWYFTLMLILMSPKLILTFKRVNSPVGGDLINLYKTGKIYFLFATFIWAFENFWYLI